MRNAPEYGGAAGETGAAAREGQGQPTVIDCDALGLITAVTDPEQLLGHDISDLPGRALSGLFAETDRPAATAWLAAEVGPTTLRLRLDPARGRAMECDVTLMRLGPGHPGRAVLTATNGARALGALRAERDELARYIDDTRIGTWAWNVQTGETRFNARWAGIVGYRLDELEPINIDTWVRLCHPEDLARSDQELQRHFAGETEWYEVEARMRHKDGRWVWIRDVGRLHNRDAEGRPDWMYGVHRDISEMKAREGQVRRAQDLLERAGMLAGFGCWELDLTTRQIFWSDETCRIHGRAPGYLPPLDEAIDYYPPEARPVVIAAIEAAMRDGTPWDFELPLVRADGRRIWVRSMGEVQFEDGHPVRISGAFQDISDRKSIEARLAEAAEETRCAHQRLNTLADEAPGAIFEHREDPSGRINLPYFSARLPDLLGVDRAAIEADGAAAAAHIHPDDAAALAEAIRASRDALTPLAFVYRLNHPQRGLRRMQLSSMPVRQPDGAVIWYGTVLDVTEQSAMQARLAETLENLRLAHERLDTIAQNVPGALFELRREPDGKIWFPYFTRKFADLLGVPEELMAAGGMQVFCNIPPEDFADVSAEFTRSRESLTLLEARHRVRLPDGSLRWVNLWAAPFAEPGGAMRWFGKALDITERLEIEAMAAAVVEEVRQAHARIASILEIVPVGLFEYRLTPDGHSDFPYTSSRFHELVGYPREWIARLGGRLLNRVMFEDRGAMITSAGESARHLTPWRMRFRYDHPLRGPLWLSAASTPRAGADGTIIWTGALYDATADVEREAELTHAYALAEQMRSENEHLALHDGLTRLPNRRFFDRHLEDRLRAARDAGGARDCALIQIDLDHFKQVNDTHGHEAGDQVLTHVAELLRGALKPGDFAARLGGDEFCILLAPGTEELQARAMVARLQAALVEPIRYRGHVCKISASFGLVVARDVTELAEEVQLYADAALYRAKSAGRNRVEVVAHALTEQLYQDRVLAAELRLALERDEFEPWFQPQIRARDATLAGAEVLMRWRHPERGILSPDSFLRVVRELRLLPEIDRRMMEKARAILVRLRGGGVALPRISFNTCAVRIHDPGLVAAAQAVEAEGTQVALELIETNDWQEESGSFRDTLAHLHAAGIEIEIDNFGLGQTSILGLMAIRPSALKIDRSLVAALPHDARNADLVEQIVQIARTLGIATVAQGVETAPQAETLKRMGCDILQGHHFAPALEETALAQYLRRSRADG